MKRNLADALVVAAHAFDAGTSVNTLVACLVLAIAMHVVAAEWGRRAPAVAPEA